MGLLAGAGCAASLCGLSSRVSLGPTPTALPEQVAVGISGGLFYVLLVVGAALFLAAFFYGRRRRR